jgi:hypothetical protein
LGLRCDDSWHSAQLSLLSRSLLYLNSFCATPTFARLAATFAPTSNVWRQGCARSKQVVHAKTPDYQAHAR